MYQYYFINCKTCNTLTQDINNLEKSEWGRKAVYGDSISA